VIDASYVLAFLLPDEREKSVDRVFAQLAVGKHIVYASSVLPYEVINGLVTAVKRKRVTAHQAAELVKLFLEWDIRYEPVTFSSVFALAVQEHLTVYDASYAWLAMEKKIPLLTFDKDLKALGK
jgi:predicted nucleic acid-binding protein